MIQVRVRALAVWCGFVAAAILPAVPWLQKASAAETTLPAEMEDYTAFGHPEAMPDEGIPDAIYQPLCCPAWDEYVVFDTLFLQRDIATNNHPLAVGAVGSPDAGQVLMTTRSMTPSVAPGVRLIYGRRTSDCAGWEVGYFGVYGMYGDALAAETNGVQVAGDLGQAVDGFANATFVEADYWSSLNSVELNVFRYGSEACQDPCARLACNRCFHCKSLDWLAGFRWAGLDEQSTLGVIGRAGDRPTPYTVNANSNLLGVQVGVRGRAEWQRWAFEGWIKTALAGASLHQSQSAVTSPITGAVDRTARATQTGGVGMIADMSFSAIYRINRVWGLRAGYNLFWLSGVALAPNQWDFSFVDDSGLGLDHGAGLFLNGGSLGLEARW